MLLWDENPRANRAGHRRRFRSRPGIDGRRAAQIEMNSIPEIGLDDPPAADQSAAVGRGFQAEASRSFGSRARL